MGAYLLAVTVMYLLVTGFFSLRLPALKTSEDYFKIEKAKDLDRLFNNLENTFEASNASFATSMLGLFGLASYNLFYEIYLVLGFLIGILFFSHYLIPKIHRYISQDKFLPQLIGQSCGSPFISTLVSVLLVFSLLAFYYTEVLSFSIHFLGEGRGAKSQGQYSIYPVLTSALLVILLGVYVSLSGYRSMVMTDSSRYATWSASFSG